MTSATAHGVARKPNKAEDDDDDDDDDGDDDVEEEDGDDEDAEDAETVRNASSASRSVIQSATAVRSNGGGTAMSNARSKAVRAHSWEIREQKRFHQTRNKCAGIEIQLPVFRINE